MNRNRVLPVGQACTLALAIAATAILHNVCCAGSERILYDVDFDGAPHAIGATPAFGFGAYPRHTPTSGGGYPQFPTGSATVVANAGPLVNRPVKMKAIDGTPSDPNHLGLTDLLFDLDDPQLDSIDRFHASVDVLPMQLRTSSGLGIFFDASSIHSVQFWPDGNIRIIDANGTNAIVGPYSRSTVYHVQMTFDRAAVRWSAAINGLPIYDGPAADTDMDRFRIAMSTGSSDTTMLAYVDNIRVTGDVPEPATAALAGLVTLAVPLLARRRRRDK